MKMRYHETVNSSAIITQDLSKDLPQPNTNQLLRIDELAKLTTLSKSCINLWVIQGKIIPPITLSPTVKVWRLGDVLKWIESRKEFSS